MHWERCRIPGPLAGIPSGRDSFGAYEDETDSAAFSLEDELIRKMFDFRPWIRGTRKQESSRGRRDSSVEQGRCETMWDGTSMGGSDFLVRVAWNRRATQSMRPDLQVLITKNAVAQKPELPRTKTALSAIVPMAQSRT